MGAYIVDCDLPGATAEEVRELERRTRAVCETPGPQGGVRHVWTLWVPSDWQLLFLFRANGPEAIRAICGAAGLPVLRLVEAVELSGV
ncbi:MAG: DUF4242 domain-containing protein [Firmicutes bacterium]|nr:DUF4242 domain-containing protein [Bacillota bacterium]